MKNVATYVRGKLALSALWRVPFGGLLLFIALYVFPATAKNVAAKGGGTPWGFLAGAIPIGLFGGFVFADGVRQVQAALERNCWVKAGPEGIAYRLPGRARPQALFLTYAMREGTIAWSDVVKMYPYRVTINGRPSSDSLIVETRNGKLSLEGIYFDEPPDLILKFIQAAAA